ncbi:MAG: hypothetical protein LIP06_06650 [Tannerellaceae bacterium]|nr:hypothetical protein [Tannerellaceae bacterium]
MKRHIYMDVSGLESLGGDDGIKCLVGNVFDIGFKTKPHCDCIFPENFPNCCDGHKKQKSDIEKWFDLFPDCCESHIQLKTKPFYSKDKYKDIVERVMGQIVYTHCFILENIDKENWFKEITDYLSYNFESFGSPPVGLNHYYHYVRHELVNKNYTNIDEWKRKNLLEYLENLYFPSKGKNNNSDLNLLQATFQRWIKTIPDLPFFYHIKKLEGKIPLNIFLCEPELNRFTGITKMRSRTQGELIEILISSTKKLLESIDTSILYKNGFISVDDEYQFELTRQNHLIKQKELLMEYSKKEVVYLKILKKWLNNEKNFLQEIKPFLLHTQTALANTNKNSENDLYNKIIDHIFYIGQGLEKSRSNYEKFDEEGYRDYLLPSLNSFLSQHISTGETFNKTGKTDILIQDINGLNVFIAECKIWKGEEEIHKAIDQLFNRYVRWRDEKVALIIFNKNVKGFTEVINKTKNKLSQHPLCEKFVEEKYPTSFSFIFKHADDNNRFIKLELMLFNYS